MSNLKEDVKAEIDNLPSLDELKGAPEQAQEPQAEQVEDKSEAKDDIEDNFDDIEVDELPDLDDDDGGDEEEEENEASATPDDEKRYSKKQLERKMEKRLKRERVKYEKRISEEVEAKLKQYLQDREQPQHEPAADEQADSQGLSPQEFARQARQEEAELKRKEDEVQQTYDTLVERGSQKYKDFKKVVDEGQYNNLMVSVAKLQPNEEDVLYYLGKKQDVAKDISRLPPVEQAAKITRIAHQLAARSSKKRVSEAPEPMEAPKPSSASQGLSYVDMLASNMSLKDIAKARQRKA